MTLHAPEFQKGVRVGGAATAVLLAFLYTVAAPTGYFRARIPFLVGSGDVIPFLFTVAVFMGAAFMGLVITRATTKQTISGAALVALACALAVSSGAAAQILPQFPESNTRWVIFAVLAFLCVVLLARERMISERKSRTGPHATGQV